MFYKVFSWVFFVTFFVTQRLSPMLKDNGLFPESFFFKIAFYQYLLLEQIIGLGDQQKKKKKKHGTITVSSRNDGLGAVKPNFIELSPEK